MIWTLAYLVGWAVCSVMVAFLVIRYHAKTYDLEWTPGDTAFAVLWSPFVALLWPLALPAAGAYLVVRIIFHGAVKRLHDRVREAS